MKLTSLFLISILCLHNTLAVETDTFTESHTKNSLEKLQSTSWGKLALGLLQVQVATNGPLDELVSNFGALKNNLQQKTGMEEQLYLEKTGDHRLIEGPILARIADAEEDIAKFTSRLNEYLLPTVEQLEGQIESDRKLIETTLGQAEKDTESRNTASELYQIEYEQLLNQKIALEDAVAYLRFLLDEAGDELIDTTNVQDELQHIKTSLEAQNVDVNSPMIKVLFEMSMQINFTDQRNLMKCINLINDILKSITEGLGIVYDNEQMEIDAYNKMQQTYSDTMELASQRTTENNEQLSLNKSEIKVVEAMLEMRQADLEAAQDDLEAETTRWAGETAIHENIMGELRGEMDALDQVIDIFANSQLTNQMLDRLNQM